MSNGPGLVMRGMVIGILVIVSFSLLVTSRLSLPKVAYAEGLPTPQPTQEIINEPDVLNDEPNPINSGECLVSGNFPLAITQWCEIITKYALTYNIPPDLIAALILQESGGNPNAYSHSGAVGLMQVMPKDGISASFVCANGPCFANRPSIAELQDPEFNIKYGTRMLAGLINKKGGLRDALKSYGPMDAGYSYADKVLGLYQRYTP
jgi:hypothetical protein